MKKISQTHNYSIDFLRFILCIAILYTHLMTQGLNRYYKYEHSGSELFGFSFCVEAFFIMSGYFLFFNKYSIKEFIIKRFFRLWPILAFSTFTIWVLQTFHLTTLSITKDEIYNLLLLQGTGVFQGCGTNGCVWFVCVLFWVGIVYAIILSEPKQKKDILGVVTILAISSFLLFKSCWPNCKVRGYSTIFEPASIMMLRGFVSMGVGVIIGFLQSEFLINKYQIKFINKYACTILEIIIFISLFTCYLFYNSTSYIFSMILFTILFLLFINKLGFISSSILNKPYFDILGKYSFAIYVMQAVVLGCLHMYANTNKDIIFIHPYISILIAMLAFIIFGIFAHESINIFKLSLKILTTTVLKLRDGYK